MIIAVALLLIHPQIAATANLPAKIAGADRSTQLIASNRPLEAENSISGVAAYIRPETQPETDFRAALPDAPLPMVAAAPAPMAFLKAGNPLTVSVTQLRAENRRKELMWKGLAIATSGAATFDAWTTRRAISQNGAQELNPLLRPFAGNASLYAAIQVGPLLMDYAGRKMMYNSHPWVRRMWWVPQSASFVSSMFCGSHNLAYH
jgi:hypothetical protein